MRRTRFAPPPLLSLLCLAPALALSCGHEAAVGPESMKEGYYEIHADRRNSAVQVDGATVNKEDEGKYRMMERPQYAGTEDAPTTRPVIRVELGARVETGSARFVPDQIVLRTGQARRVLLGTNFDGGYLTYEVGELNEGTIAVRFSLELQGSANVFSRFVARMKAEDTQTFTTTSRSGQVVYVRVHMSALDPFPPPALGDMRLVTPKDAGK